MFGYARVSTKGQAKDGNSLEAQEKALLEAGASKIYTDSFTGTKIDRPKLQELLNQLKSGDTLIVTKLDRLSRSVSQASDLITSLLDKGVKVNVLNLGILDNSSVNTLMRNVLLAFAQFERDMIVERTQEGKQIARENAAARGEKFKEGRPEKYKQAQIENALHLLENHSYNEVVELTGISRSTLIRMKKKAEINK